jgi:hypothetical protein
VAFRRRKASFIGSEVWRSQDVEITWGNPNGTTVDMLFRDKPSGIWIRFYRVPELALVTPMLAELAHRVKQLTF